MNDNTEKTERQIEIEELLNDVIEAINVKYPDSYAIKNPALVAELAKTFA